MTHERDHERDAEICDLYYSGMTGIQIADHYNMTRQRVSQILHRCGVDVVPVAKRRLEQSKTKIAQYKDAVIADYEVTRSKKETVQNFKDRLSDELVRRILKDVPAQRKASIVLNDAQRYCSKRYTTDEILQGIRNAEAKGITTANDYKALALSHPDEYPSMSIIMRYFDTWNNARKEAGITPRDRSGPERRFTKVVCNAYLNEFVKDMRRKGVPCDGIYNPTIKEYEAWARRVGGRPSSATIRLRFFGQTWADMLKNAETAMKEWV